MYSLMTAHIDRLDRQTPGSDSVIRWACPVPFFGDVTTADVATVGINPSNREFTDGAGRELDGGQRRLPTLGSLGLARWRDADSRHVRAVLGACSGYFRSRPYDRWFGVLERALLPGSVSYYGQRPTACHIDLVPFATSTKWGELSPSHRRRLLDTNREALGRLVRSSRATVLVLNGRSVVDAFVGAVGSQLDSVNVPEWNLDRGTSAPVAGVRYHGIVTEIGGVPLGRVVVIAGYNHNLQSSFGISRPVLSGIGAWLSTVIGERVR